MTDHIPHILSATNSLTRETRPSTGQVVHGLVLIMVLLGSFLVRWGYRSIPLERDEGMYLYSGAQILTGSVPYVDIMEAKPPGLFLTYAAFYALGGGDLEHLQVLMAMIVTINTVLVYAFTRLLLGSGPALTSAIIFSTLTMSLQASGFTMQAEHFVVCFAFSGLLLICHGLKRHRAWYLLWGGALMMWATLTKQNALFLQVFAGLWIFLQPREDQSPHTLRSRLLPFLVGTLVVLLIPMGWLIHTGAWEGMRTWLGEVAVHYVSRISIADGMDLFKERFVVLFKDSMVAWTVALAGIIAMIAGGTPRTSRGLSLLLFLFSLLTIVPGLRFFGHYFLLLFPALAIASAWAVLGLSHGILNNWKGLTQGQLHTTFAIVLIFGVVTEQWRPFLFPDHSAILRYVYTTNPFHESKLVAEEIQRRAEEGDELLVMGFEPQIYLYTGINAPLRWVNMDVLLYDHPIADEARREFTTTVTKSPPRFVVWVQHVTSWMPPPDADQTILAAYWDQLMADYDVVAWYEQDPPMQLRIVTGEAAQHHVPKGELYMFLAVRKERAMNAS